MNKLCYKTVFSEHLGALVAVGEHTSSQSKGQGAGTAPGTAPAWMGARFMGVLALSFASVSLVWSQTLPQGAQVTQGTVSFSQAANQLAITQSTAKAVVNWQSFDIGQNAKVNITQPSSQSVLLNRVLSDNPTHILGQLQANGQVVLVNPKGIVVGSDGSVSASAFTASTLNISDADFMAGKARYTRDGSTGQVINKGRIEVAPGGYVALLGASVSNEGKIIAPQGGVALGAADSVTVPVGRTGKIKLELTPASINASVANTKDGVIVAEGGQVYLQAAALGHAVASVLSSGSIDTSGVQAGAVHLLADGGNIRVDGRITANSSGQDDQGQARAGGDIVIGRDAETGVLAKATDVSGAKLESTRGFVETSGDVLKADQVSVKAREWLLDPTNITIAASGASGTAYASNYSAAADSVILASDIAGSLNNGTSVTIATSAAGSSVGNIAVNESISKTAGTDATLTLQAHGNITVAANKTITSNAGKLNVLFNSDSDAAGGGAIVFNASSGITSNGGNITLGGGSALNGSGFATADGVSTLQGISLNTATINAGGGNIAMNGKTAVTNYAGSLSNVGGIYMTGGSISTTGSGTINLTGQNQNTDTQSKGFELASGTITGGSTGAVTITGDSRGVASSTFTYIRGALINGTVTSTGGNIGITGYGGSGAQYEYGVDVGGSVIAVGTGAISISGTAGAGGSGGNVGVNTSGSGTISSVDGAITITGTGGIGNGAVIRDHGVSIGGTNAIKSTGSGSITVTGTVTNNDNAYSDGVLIGGGGLSTNTGNIKLDGTALVNYQKAVEVKAAVSATSGNIYIRSPGANITTSSTGTLSANNISIDNSNGTVDANTGVITPGTSGASLQSGVGSRGVDISGSITAANNLSIYGNHTGAYTGVSISGATTTISGKNVTIYGKSSADNGVLLSGATLSGAYLNVTGETTTAYTGFAWNGGQIKTTGTSGTSTASVVKGISAASSTGANVYGALMMFADGSVNAATGTTLTLAGEATTLTTGQNIKEQGILVQGGRTLTMSGDITLDGSSKSSEGIAFGGTVNMATVTGVTNKLTLKGTTAASSNSALNGVNFSGAITGNASTSSINLIGEAKNLSGTNYDSAVSMTGTITGNAANVNVQAPYGKISIDGAISGANISVDNTGGSISATTGTITAGTGTSSYTNAININKALTATGNINVLGNVATTTHTGVNLTATAPISSSGTATTINIASNGNVVNAAAITESGATGTGSNINLTSTSGTITGAGAIGDTTNKNTSVTFTQGGTSTYDGAINAANFTKAGAGALTLDSWIATTPATSNISNAYTVKGGGLTLSPGGTLAWLAPVSVNVENTSSFLLNANSSSRWNNTAFNFTGGLGGGTMNLAGNPIGASGTTNTFSTSGGATNTLVGGLNANSANVNFNLAAATSGTSLLDGSFAAIAFTQNTQGGYGLGSGSGAAGTVNVAGGGNLLFKDVVKTTNFNINAGAVQFGDGSAATSAATADLQATNVSIASGAKLMFNRAEAYTNSSVITGAGSLIQGGTGVVTLTGNSTSFAGSTTVNAGKTLALGTGGSLGTAGSTVSLVDSASQLHFTGASGVSNVGSAIVGAGKVTQSGAGTTILLADNSYAGTTTVSGGTLQVGNAGTTGTLGAGDVTLSNNANLSYVLAEATTITNNISGAGNVSASITGTSSDLAVNHTIALTGGTVNLSADHNLSVTQAISTTNGTDSAVMLVAGKPANAGTASGGDVTVSGSGSVIAGTSGRVTYMTGSIAGSTGVGTTPGNNRYNSDEATTNYTTALGSGAHTIYREQPLVTVQVNDASKTYDGLVFTGGSLSSTVTSGSLIGSDTVATLTANATYGGSSQGAKDASATPYVISASDAGGKSALGYGVTYTSGALTINKANLTITANDDARFVGRTDNLNYGGVSITGFVNGETSGVLGGSLTVTRSNTDMGAGYYSGVLSAGGLSSNNYNMAYKPGSYTIVPADQLLIKTANTTVTYGTTPVYDTTAQYLDSHSDEIITLSRTGAGNQYTFSDGAGTTISTLLKPYASSSLAGTSTSGNTVVGSYSVKDLNPTVVGANFVGAPVFVGNLTVSTQAITPNASGVTKVYDGTTAMNNVVVGLTGKLSNDIVSISGSGAFSQKNASNNLSYTVSNITLSGADASNYHLSSGSSLSGSDGSITPAALVLSASNVTKTYDGTTSALGTAYATQNTQLFGSDTLSGGTFAFQDKNAGTGNKVVTVSGVTINDDNNGGNYSVTYVDNTTSTISKANLTLKAVTDTKIYDGMVTSGKTVEVINASGSSDVVTVAQEFASKNALGLNASTLQVATGYTIKDTAGVDMSGNYDISAQTAAGTINKKDVTLASISAANKTYDGTNAASITAGAIATGVGSETLAISGSGTFSDKHAADGKTVTISDVSALTKTDGSGSWNNYNLTTTGALSTTANITPRALSLSAVTDNKTYDGTTSSSGTVVISGNQVGDTITANQVFDSKHALGTGASTLKIDTVNINDGNDGKNYIVTQTDATGTIQKASLTVTATQVEKTYDGTTLATGTGTVGSLTGQAAGETVNAAGSQAFLSKNAGTGDKYVRASGVTIKDSANADVTQNYDIRYVDNTTSTIHKANLSVAMADQTKVYDGTTQATLAAGAITATGVTVNGVTETATVTQTAGNYNSKNVAAANTVTANLSDSHFTSGTADVSNYNLPTTVSNTNSTITLAALTLTAYSELSKVYNGTEQSVSGFAITSGSLQGTDSLAVDLASITAGAKATNAGTYASTVNDSAYINGNYAITKVNGTLFIDQKEVSLSAAKIYDGSKTLTGTQLTITTGVGAETLGFTQASIYSKNVADNNVNYVDAVTLSNGNNGGLASNYKLPALTAGDSNSVVLTAKALTGSIADVTTTYGSATATGAVSLSGTIGTDEVLAANTARLVNAATSTSGQLKAGSYAQTVDAGLSGADAGNYSFAGVNTPTANYVVNKLALTGATIAAVTTTYATAADAGAVSFGNVQGSDKVIASASIVGGTNSSSSNLKAGSYKQTATAISGDDAGNYSFGGITTTDNNYVVNKLALTGAAITGVTTTYATAADAGAVSFGNVQGGDKVSASAAIVDAANSSSGNLKAGSYKQTATAINGDDATNYSFGGITTTDNNYVVNKLALTGAAIAAVTTTYATAADAGAVSFGNVQGGDKVSASAAIVDAANSSSGNLKAGSYKQTSTAISGDDASNYSFSGITTTGNNYVVNKLALTGATIAGVTTTYATAADAGAVSFTNIQVADKVTSSASIVNAANSSSGNLKAGSYQQTAATITGDDADNYSFSGFTTSHANYFVGAKNLVIAASASNKVYDATTTASTALSSDMLSGDNLSLSSTSANFDNKNVGTGKTVTVSGLAISGTDAGNYQLTNASATTTATIDKKSVTLDSITAANKIYDGNTTATITAGLIGGTVAGESLSVTGSGVFADKNAATGIAVHVQDITALSHVNGTGDWGNYNLTTTGQASTTANINKAALQVALMGTVEKTYDGTTSSNNLNSHHFALTGWVGSEGATISQAKGSYASKNVADNSGTGTVSVTLAESDFSASSGTLLSNYVLPTSATGLVGKITPATLSIKVNDTAAFVTQDAGLALNQGVSYNGFVNGETAASALSGSPTRIYTGTAYPVAGTYENVYGLSAAPTANHGNYSIRVIQGKLTVVPADKLLIGIGSKTSTYGDLTSSSAGASANIVTAQYCLSANCSGGLVNLNVTSTGNGNWLATDNTGTSVTFSTLIDSTGNVSTGGFLNVGNYIYGSSTITPANNSNFNGSVVNGGVLTIQAKNLSLSASNVTKVYDGGTALTGRTLDTAGVMGTDSVSASSAGGSFDHKNAGARNYSLTGLSLNGADAKNYAFSLESLTGTGSITPKDVTLTAGTVTKTYDGNKQYTVKQSDLDSLSGQLISGDTVSAAAISFIDKNVARDASGQVLSTKSITLDSVSLNDGNNGGNYTVTLAGNNASVITPKTLTATEIADVRTTYGTAATAAVSLTGAVSGDMVSGSAQLVGAQYSGSGNLMAGQYFQTTSSELTGNEAGNYTLSPFTTNSANHVVLKKDLVISASATDKIYDTTTLANASLSSDMLSGDRLSLSSNSANFDSKNVGTGKTVTVSGLAISGADAGNYQLTNTNAATTAAIAKADLTLKAATDTKIYDGTLISNQLVAIDNATGGSDTVVARQEFTHKDVLGTHGSTLQVMPDFTVKDASGADMRGNYNIKTERAAGTISPKTITLTGITAGNKTYDGNTSAEVSVDQASFNGMVAGDQLTIASKGVFSDKNAGSGKVVSLSNTLGGADLHNYAISDQTWTTADIVKKDASITGTNTQVTYNGQTQVQDAAVLNGFIDDDLNKGTIEVTGLASGHNSGRYTSNLSASGVAAANYNIHYQQADLIIDKARLGFTGTQANDKLVDGTTQAQVKAGTLTGLVGNETLNIASVSGQFNNADVGRDKPVEVVYRLSNGKNGGLASNYDWSPVVVKANITATTNTRPPFLDVIKQQVLNSRLYFQGFSGLGGMGAATGHAEYAARQVNPQACSPQRLENCFCERLDDASMEICYSAVPKNQTAP